MPIQPRDTKTYIPKVEEMESSLLEASKKGMKGRILLLTNPGNPLGTLYPESTLKVSCSLF